MSGNPDSDHLEFERLHRRRRLRLALVLAVAVFGPLIWLVVVQAQVVSARREARLGAAQKAELAALLDQRETRGRESVEHWNLAMRRDAVSALIAGTEPCPVKVVPPPPVSAGAYVKFATHDAAFGKWPLCILRPADDAPSCARTWVPDPELAPLRARIAEDDVYTWDLEQAKSAPPADDPPSVVVIVSNEVRPTVHSPAAGRVSFVPGTMSGRMFLYTPEQQRFICAGDTTVKNSKTIDIEVSGFGEAASAQQKQAEYETQVALERDLEVLLRYAAPRVLRLVQPAADGGP